jgi:CO/xanthine dehydrogenase Mo-binding subunit
MAKHRGRGFATIEYPTGMNQNGDPSQAWIKIKPDGRVDVFSGTSDIGNGSKTIQTQIVAETLGVPYDWITYDNSNTDSSPVCTGTFASRATFVAGNAVLKAARNARTKLLEIASKELEIDPNDLEVVDGEVIAKGAPQKKISVPDVAAAATWVHGELITGVEIPLPPVRTVSGYLKVRDRVSYEFALTSAAVALEIDDGVIREARIGLGGVGSKPWRAGSAERVLRNQRPTVENFRDAAEAALVGAWTVPGTTFKVELAKRTLVRQLEIVSEVAR